MFKNNSTMKKIAILFIFLFFTSISNGQKNYEDLWYTAEQYELQLLPKSSLKIVDSIYKLAKSSNNKAQVIKTLFYKSKFKLILEEDAQLKVVNEFKTTINNSNGITKSILQNILADTYWSYYTRNRYQFYNRTKTNKKVDSVDFRTWDLNTIFKEIHQLYQSSLARKEVLQQTDIRTYKALLKLEKNSEKYRPTLYDLLTHNALTFYKTSETSITKPSYQFEINDTLHYSESLKFSKINFTSKDSLSLHLNALKIYQDLINFHQQSRNLKALGVVDLERLNFIHEHSVLKNKEELFMSALKKAARFYTTEDVSGLFEFEIARIYHQQANDFLNDKNEAHHFRNKEALNICSKVIKKFPKSIATEKCKILVEKIKKKSIQITTEAIVPIDKHSRSLIRYKNLNHLYFSIYQITKEQYLNSESRTTKEEINFIKKLKKVTSWDAPLKNVNDYLNHTTEIVLPKLNQGTYLIVASQKPKLNKDNIYGTSKIQATNIAIVENNGGKNNSYQILDRITGKPLQRAFVNISAKNSRSKNVFQKTLTTNSKGFVTFNIKDYYNATIKVKHQKDVAIFDNVYLYSQGYSGYDDDEDDKIVIKPFVFTDRSIYRPGQKVYFKSIIIKKTGKQSDLFINEYVEVTLYNTNDDVIKTLNLKLNKFGSVAGEFDIPNNGVTGKYYISIEDDSDFYDKEDYDFEDKDFTIHVEEYKRPKFETTFEKVKDAYKVNDTVLISGNATSFSGAKISDAKVIYTVKRKVNYPSWYRGYNPYQSSEQEITKGETNTDDDGNFKIRFKAIPKSNSKKENLPIFQYEITADVTDINGETRSETTIVKVGYHMIEATINVNAVIDRKSTSEKISININNLNGEKANAQGTLVIYKLEAPKFPLRRRPWKAPDYQEISKEEFKKLFPNDPYTDDEGVITNWNYGAKVFSTPFDTEQQSEILFSPSVNWEIGKYKIVLETKDQNGTPIKEERIITLFDTKEKRVADNSLFYMKTDKLYYNVGETAKVTIGSASKDLTVTMIIEKNNQIEKIKIFHLSDETKTFKVKVRKEDTKGFALKFHYTAYNHFDSRINIIGVTRPNEKIEIVTNVFRDKSEPGKKETWSFTIKDDAKNKIAAEVLASMYDTSLDQFKEHAWSFTPKQFSSYQSYQTVRAYTSFKNKTFRFRNLPYRYYRYPIIKFDAINTFGFSLNSNRWTRKKYLKKLKERKENSRTTYDKIITGVVKDNESNLPGVSIWIKGTTFGTNTDFDGKYSIKVQKGDVLVFNYLGYESNERSVEDQKAINVFLKEDENRLDEIVMVAYGATNEKKKMKASVSSVVAAELYSDNTVLLSQFAGNATGVQADLDGFWDPKNDGSVTIRGVSSSNDSNQPLYIVDGVPLNQDEFRKLQQDNILNIETLKGTAATAIYGNRGAGGVVLITTKSGQAKINKELSAVKARKNFQETAFFYPQLRTNKKGEISFTFTMPESLTRWKLQLLAHTEELKTTIKSLQTVTQKKLMVVPNMPRFLREGDQITLSSKVSNLTQKSLSGFIRLELTDAMTGNVIDTDLNNTNATQNFTVNQKGNTVVSWKLHIPLDIQAVQYKVVAKAGDFSDGEQNILPVLSNRTLVTETLPIWVRSNQTKTFELKKLTENNSTTLKHHQLTLEMTSNPAWYALQALPYLMEYPYECAEQTFSRYYANTIASHVANSNPNIKKVFDSWKSSEALLSNLEKNQELKSLVIQETPWLRDAQSETEQKKRIGLLFDLNRMKNEQQKAFSKLIQMQMDNGGFPWFKGSRYASTYITQHIVGGFGHLKNLKILDLNKTQKSVIDNARNYLDDNFATSYQLLLQSARDIKDLEKRKKYLERKHLGYYEIQYLYGNSFYDSIQNPRAKEAIDFYMKQSKVYWKELNLYAKAQIALVHYRKGNQSFAKAIMKSLEENSIDSEELGMYWKENTSGYYYYQSQIETQALLIEAFSEIIQDETIVESLKVWLLKHKQTNRWKTTKATTEAVYALLLNGQDWLSMNELVDVSLGEENILPKKKEELSIEAGSGYFKTSWKGNEVSPSMGKVTVTAKNKSTTWGGLYWQYFEDLDKITSAKSPLQLKKKLLLKVNTDTGKELQEISSTTQVKVGDLITVRIELKSDREMEFIHMKDMRASGVEPVNVFSKYKWQDGLGYYESTRDAATNFFFDRIPKGTYVFEYDVRVNNAGDFSNGITTIQSMYAPEFSSHSEGVGIKVD